MIKPHLKSLHSLCQHPNAGLNASVDNTNVRAIPVHFKDWQLCKKYVSKVNERGQLSETSASSGSQETVSKKTPVFVSLLRKGMDRLYKTVMECVSDKLLKTLLTTEEENLCVVSHFKHDLFTVLTYGQDFGTVCRSLKCTSRWSAKYYTHDKLY